MKGETSVHSPAEGLTDGFAVGGGGNPGQPSVHPDINMTGKSASDGLGQGNQSKDNESVAGVGATSGAVPFAQLAEVPESAADFGPMAGGLGTPPKP